MLFMYNLLGTELENEVLSTPNDEEVCSTADSERQVSAQVVDLNDPSNWTVHLDAKTVDLLMEKGPVVVCSFLFSPRIKKKIHFSDDFYERNLPNRVKAHRDWLVYQRKQILYFACLVNCATTAQVGLRPNLVIRAIMIGDIWQLC